MTEQKPSVTIGAPGAALPPLDRPVREMSEDQKAKAR
jgi:hypothetical protein